MSDLDELVNEKLLIKVEIIAAHTQINAHTKKCPNRFEKISTQGGNFRNYGILS